MYPGHRNTQIKLTKYPNRRYYDTTRSRHVTLEEIYDLIVDGYDVEVTDSKTHDDITNLVLMQVILDRDPPKLELLPPGILHQVIRSNRQMLRAFFDRTFGPMLTGYTAFQKQVESVLRQNAAANPMMAPAMDWAQSMMQMFVPNSSSESPAPSQTKPATQDNGHSRDETLNDLREQLSKVQGELERLRKRRKQRTKPIRSRR